MKKSEANWTNIIYIWGYHLILLFILPVYLYSHTPSKGLVLSTIVLCCLSGLGITAGSHRLFSHSTYKASKLAESVLLFCGTLAAQGSAIRWSYDHRLHHSHVDKEDDPYSVKKGFWHAHILWLFKKEKPMTKPTIVADLLRNKLLVFQDKHYMVLVVSANVLTTYVTFLITGDFFGAFILSYILRQFITHHSTWFINSAAHYWGHQNYSTEHSAMDNYILCFLTFGEGYHNYHHTFANDYRNGIKWYHFDPTKWLIWTLSKLGLASNLRRSKESRILKLMIKEHKEALIKKLKRSIIEKREEAEQTVHQVCDSLIQKISNLQDLVKKHKKASKDALTLPESLQNLSREIKELKKSLRKDWKNWKRFTKNIMKMKEKAA